MSDMNINSEEWLAYELLQAGDYPRAYQSFRSLAQQGSSYAWSVLGWMHQSDEVGQIDIDESISCYRRAAEGGFTKAFYSLGTVLLRSCDEEGARQAFEAGAKSGDLRSTYQFGLTLLDKDSGYYDKEEGLKLLKQAASRGHFFSQRKLLSVELEKNRSLFNRFIVGLKIIFFMFSGIILHFKDRHSERL